MLSLRESIAVWWCHRQHSIFILGISPLDEMQAIATTTAAYIHVVELIFSAQTSAPA